MSKTAVVILNWNGRQLLERFIPVVLKNSDRSDVEVIVADNASTDDSLTFLRDYHSQVKTILLDKNYGFAGGYNKALANIEADYFVLLNSDVAPEEDWLDPLIEAMDADSQLAACMPKIKAYNNPDEFEYAGASGGFIDKFGYPFCRGRILNQVEKDNGQYDDPVSVFWATGAALMIRAGLYQITGGLDESFFAHMEEIDLCWRIKNMGYDIKVIPQSVVFHIGGATLDQMHPHKTYLNFRNNLLMMLKNVESRKLPRLLFARMVLDGVAAVHFLTKLEFRFFWAVFKSHLAFYSLFVSTYKKRKQLKPTIVNTHHKEVYSKSVIWSFYLKNIRKYSDL